MAPAGVTGRVPGAAAQAGVSGVSLIGMGLFPVCARRGGPAGVARAPARWPRAGVRRGCSASPAWQSVCPGTAGAAGGPAEGAVCPAPLTHGVSRSLLPPPPPLGPPAGEGLPASPTAASCFPHVFAAVPRVW